MAVTIDYTLYEDSQIKIEIDRTNTFLRRICLQDSEVVYFMNQQDISRLSRVSRDDLERDIMTFNDKLLSEAISKGLSAESIGLAISKAYLEIKDREHYQELRRNGTII